MQYNGGGNTFLTKLLGYTINGKLLDYTVICVGKEEFELNQLHILRDVYSTPNTLNFSWLDIFLWVVLDQNLNTIKSQNLLGPIQIVPGSLLLCQLLELQRRMLIQKPSHTNCIENSNALSTPTKYCFWNEKYRKMFLWFVLRKLGGSQFIHLLLQVMYSNTSTFIILPFQPCYYYVSKFIHMLFSFFWFHNVCWCCYACLVWLLIIVSCSESL